MTIIINYLINYIVNIHKMYDYIFIQSYLNINYTDIIKEKL